MSNVFANEYKKYVSAGKVVIPLFGKAPKLSGWNNYQFSAPSEAIYTSWETGTSGTNIGILLGKCNNLVAVDIDDAYPDEERLIMAVLPPTPAVRFGKKGRQMFYRYTPAVEKKVKFEDGKRCIVEILTNGQQSVLAPSIHPDTGKPYSWEGNPLYELFDELPALPDNFVEVLERVLGLQASGNKGAKATTGGNGKITANRHDFLIGEVGKLSREVVSNSMSFSKAMSRLSEAFARIDNSDGEQSLEYFQEELCKLIISDQEDAGKKLPALWLENSEDYSSLIAKYGLDTLSRRMLVSDFCKLVDETDKEINGRWEDNSHRVRRLVAIIFEEGFDESEVETLCTYIAGKRHSDSKLSSNYKKYLMKWYSELAYVDERSVAKGLLDYLEKHDILIRIIKDRGNAIYLYNPKTLTWEPSEETAKAAMYAYTEKWEGGKYKEGAGFDTIRKRAIEYAMTDPDHKGYLKESFQPRKGFNAKNGFVNEAMELEPHSEKNNALYVSPYNYNPSNTNCPKITETFRRVLAGDFESTWYNIRKYLKLSLMGNGISTQRALVLFGKARTGKSTISKLIEGLFAGGVTNVPADKLGEKFTNTPLEKSYINSFGDQQEVNEVSGNSWTSILGGEEIQVEYKGVDPHKIKPTCGFLMCTNNYFAFKASKTDATAATRRLLPVTFKDRSDSCEFVTKDSATLANELLEEEGEGFLNLILSTDLGENNNEFKTTGDHKAYIEACMKNSDQLYRYLTSSKNIRKTPVSLEATVTLDEFYKDYEDYTIDNGGYRHKLSLEEFSNRLEKYTTRFEYRFTRGGISGIRICKDGSEASEDEKLRVVQGRDKDFY